MAARGALRGAGERARERARRVPRAQEYAAFVGPSTPLPRGGPARAHALYGHGGRRGLHGAGRRNLIGGAEALVRSPPSPVGANRARSCRERRVASRPGERAGFAEGGGRKEGMKGGAGRRKNSKKG